MPRRGRERVSISLRVFFTAACAGSPLRTRAQHAHFVLWPRERTSTRSPRRLDSEAHAEHRRLLVARRQSIGRCAQYAPQVRHAFHVAFLVVSMFVQCILCARRHFRGVLQMGAHRRVPCFVLMAVAMHLAELRITAESSARLGQPSRSRSTMQSLHDVHVVRLGDYLHEWRELLRAALISETRR